MTISAFGEKLRVLELANVLAGPAVGMFFAELGAEVIKVENINGGDVTRSWKLASEDPDTDISAYFSSVNWGKRSLVIDLSTEKGKEIIYRLVESTDIVICSYKAGDAEKLGVDHNTLSKIRPDIIYASITGFGESDPRSGYDAIIQAESGFMYMNGDAKGGPVKMPVALIDILAAHQLKEGILLAIIKRITTGEGSSVSASLIKSSMAALANQAANWLVAGHDAQRQGSEHPNIVPYGTVFSTKDEKQLILAIGTDRQFQELMAVLGAEDIALDPKYSTNQQRVVNKENLLKEMEGLIGRYEISYLLKELHQRNIPAGAILSVGQALSSTYAKEMILEEKDMAGLRTISFMPEGGLRDLTVPPHFGAHSAEILTEQLGITPEEIYILQEKKIIK